MFKSSQYNKEQAVCRGQRTEIPPGGVKGFAVLENTRGDKQPALLTTALFHIDHHSQSCQLWNRHYLCSSSRYRNRNSKVSVAYPRTHSRSEADLEVESFASASKFCWRLWVWKALQKGPEPQISRPVHGPRNHIVFFFKSYAWLYPSSLISMIIHIAHFILKANPWWWWWG